jgi:hypothetical protein
MIDSTSTSPAFLCFAFYLLIVKMAISVPSDFWMKQLKAPFVDSSNCAPLTTNPKHHTHLHLQRLLPPKIASYLYSLPRVRHD